MTDNILNYGTSGFFIAEGDIIVGNHIAQALLGSIVHNKIILKTPLGNLTADGMFLTVGASGTCKTLPIIKAIDIANSMDIVIPSRFTSESLGKWFYVKDKDKYVNKPYGIIFWNEASKYFSESANKTYLNGMIEAMSSLHDHLIAPEYYKQAEYGIPQRPYVSMVGNMVEHYLKQIPDYFWNQGLAGRILWRYILPTEPTNNNGSWLDFTIRNKTDGDLLTFIDLLKELDKELRATDQITLTLTEDADKMVHDFKFKIETKWYKEYKLNPLSINYAYKKRLTELLGKTALRIAIGRHFAKEHTLIGLESGGITKEDVDMALKIVEDSSTDLDSLFNFVDLAANTTKEDIQKRNKKDAIKRYLQQGEIISIAMSKTNSYACKTSSKDCFRELLAGKEIKIKDDKGHYEVINNV